VFPSKIATTHAFFGAARGAREYHERMRIVLGVLAGCALAACARGVGDGHGSDGGGSDDPNPVTATLSIAPAASALVIMNGVPAHATYTATLTWTDGTTRDVTADTQFGIDGNFGTFAANVLAISAATRTQVMGLYHDKIASADVTASALTVRIDPSLPPTIGDLFGGPADPSPKLQINYPPAGAVMPRNIDDFEVHWTDGNQNDVFEVSLKTDLHEVRLYVLGGNGLQTQGPMASWAAFQETEWIPTASVASSVLYQVRGATRDVSRGVSTVTQTMQLSNEKMDGGLYYWASTSVSGATGIFRYDMHDPVWPMVRPTTAEPFLTTNETSGRCVACHVLSRDGTKVAVTFEDMSVPGPGTLVDVPSFVKSKVVPPDVASWNFGTFTPDNAQFLSVEHGVLVVRDVATHAVLATMTTTPAMAWVTQPDLSPDGKRLVYVRPALAGTDFDFKVGQLYLRSYDEATHTFGQEVQLLSDGQNNFFPSWSPDGNWIAFNKSSAADSSYDDNTTSAWVIKADDSLRPIELAMANQGPGLTNSAVRWAPFQQTFGPTNAPMFWLTMSSKRDFGVRLRNTGLAQRGLGAKRAQLWMTPFFPAQADQGLDPSGPAFRLPFQDLGSSNQTAQWTEHVVAVVQ